MHVTVEKKLQGCGDALHVWPYLKLFFSAQGSQATTTIGFTMSSKSCKEQGNDYSCLLNDAVGERKGILDTVIMCSIEWIIQPEDAAPSDSDWTSLYQWVVDRLQQAQKPL